MKYDRQVIEGAALWQWDGDDFYVLSYPPTRRRTIVTNFILDFKNDDQEAVALATELILSAVQKIEPVLKKGNCKYIVSIPPSGEGKRNVPCERVCQAVERKFEWIKHLPKALRRTNSVAKSAFSPPWDRPTYDDHKKSIAYAGPVQQQDASFLMLDDVITQGNVSRACRDILKEQTECKRVIGAFLGRTE